METIEQRRAKHAWKKSHEGVNNCGKGYVNLAKALPALIKNSGLMQVMAFLEDKKSSDAHCALAKHLRDWLHQRFRDDALDQYDGFMEAMLEDSRRNQEMTAEAFAWLKWLRQMAAAQNSQ